MKLNSNLVWAVALAATVVGGVWFSWSRYKRLYPPYSPEIGAALQLAGGNRGELEKALKHYANDADKLKLRAAEFLIANMPGKYSEYCDAPWNDVAAAYLRWSSLGDRQRLQEAYKLDKPVVRQDVEHITAEYLINNIEMAFEAWRGRPWGKTVPFEAFCEEILPYRFGVEPLENWRAKALASFADLDALFRDSIKSAVEACAMVNAVLPAFKMDRDFPAMSFSQLMATPRGMCDNLAALTAFSMRALGIPVTFDFTVQWPDYPTGRGHAWNTVRDSAGRHLSFGGGNARPFALHHENTRAKVKIYRRRFANRYTGNDATEGIPPALRGSIADVSAEYPGMAKVKVVRKYRTENTASPVCLVLMRENSEDIPVGLALSSTRDTIIFGATGKNALYLPACYNNGTLQPVGDPFWLDDDGRIFSMNPDSPDSVFEITGILDVKSVAVLLLSRMKNGVFEGANKPDFSDAQIIHNIAKIPAPDYNTVVLKQPARYRYVRYRTPPMGFCNVAEIEFYSPAGKRLAGKNIGTAGAISGAPEMTCDKAFDGKVGTYFECREEDKSTAWTGLDLLTETAIGTIRYCPRIDPVGAKPIVKGHVYEAFYFTSGGWTSLGKTTADSNRLRLKILRQSLFYLRDHTDAVNGKQMSAGGF